jgi:uncharacterized membrane protein (UPF0127 family)
LRRAERNALGPPIVVPKRSRIFVLIGLSVLLLTGSWFMMNQKDADTIIVTFPNGTQLETEVADTPEKIFFGLAFREGLPPQTGMLYIFESSDRHRMRTKAFKIPVDMIWADESHHIVHLVANATPCEKDPCPFYGPPPENARYVIETAAGFITQEHVEPGMELKFTLRI